MKNSEAVAMLKSLQRTYEDSRANGGFEVLLNKRIDALQLAIEAMESESSKFDKVREAVGKLDMVGLTRLEVLQIIDQVEAEDE